MNDFFRWTFVALLVAHGVAHVPGFAVAWRLMVSPELPYHTALFKGRLEMGEMGIRLVGLFWLGLGLAFVGAAALLVARWRWAPVFIGAIALLSLLLCVAEWPFSRIGVGTNLLVLVLLPMYEVSSWRVDTTALTASLTAARGGKAAPADAASPLPPVVSRYLSRALGVTPRLAVSGVYQQQAEFMVGGAWRPLTANQYVSTSPPGFIWDARIAMAPGLSVFVRDSYVGGHGAMRVAFAAMVPMVDQHDRPELDAGALHRYLAELVWMPSALVPGPRVRWEPLDERSARATMTDGPISVSLDFRFNAEGDVEEIFTPKRFAEHGGTYVEEPWQVRCSDHQTFDGVRVPAYCEVSWVGAGGPVPYWRGRVTSIRYELDASPQARPVPF